ncbi:MAG: hypothetical protein U0905_14200 [Pirellulales bacterium]
MRNPLTKNSRILNTSYTIGQIQTKLILEELGEVRLFLRESGDPFLDYSQSPYVLVQKWANKKGALRASDGP